MPKEIDCPDCKWRHTHSSLNPVNQHELVLCGNCNNGKIIVYTEEEFQEAIKAEREECLQDFVKKLSTGYTIKECVKAIRAK